MKIELKVREKVVTEEARATGATALVNSCPRCERNFKDATMEYGGKIEVYDISETARKAIWKEELRL